MREKRDRRSGNALILFTVAVPFFVLPLVGLAIDGTILYSVKAKLSAAVDGGAIAAARSLNVGMSFDAQKTTATKTAEQFVRANFRPGYWDSEAVVLDPPVEVKEDTSSSYKRRTVAITASVRFPLLFMRIMGFEKATVAAYGKAARRDVRMVILLDKSSSMTAMMPDLRSGAKDFVDRFAEGRDQIGLVAFGTSGTVAYPAFDPVNGTGPRATFKSDTPNISTLVSSMQAGGSFTGTADGLWLAYLELLKNPLPGALNVIVMFTDGLPNGITGIFNKSGSSYLNNTCTYRNTTDTSKYMIGSLAQAGNFSTGTGNVRGIYELMNAPTAKRPSVTAWLSSTTIEEILPSPVSDTCKYKTDVNTVKSDLSILPPTDYYGNSTTGNGYLDSKLYAKEHLALDRTKVGVHYQIGLVSWNAADDCARRIRNDVKNGGINPVIFTIGLEGTEGADTNLMLRVSNVNSAQNHAYDSTRPAGKYFAITGSGAIAQAFSQVASEILRLTN